MNQVFVVIISVIYLAKIKIKFFYYGTKIEYPSKKGGKARARARATTVSGFACNSICSDYRGMDFQKEMSGFFMHSVVSSPCSPSSGRNLNATIDDLYQIVQI